MDTTHEDQTTVVRWPSEVERYWCDDGN